MILPGPPTRIATTSRLRAQCIVVAAVGLAIWGIVASLSMGRWKIGMQGTADLEFYLELVEKIQNGQGYYDALASRLAKPNSQALSIFQWRQPTLATLIGKSRVLEPWHLLLLASALAAVICTARTFLPKDRPIVFVVGTILLMGGAFSWSIYEPDAFLATEPWCEVLILFSLCAYARGWWKLGVLAAVAALALRELVLPYCLAMASIALWKRNRWELVAWAACLTVYAGFFWWHASEVAMRQAGTSTTIASWLHAPHLDFVLSSCAMNVFLRPLPPALLAIYLPIALIGLAGWPGETGRRLLLAASIYAIAFTFCRAADYWGYMYTAMLLLGALRSPPALRDLWRAAFTC
jgi:hypothetical protein